MEPTGDWALALGAALGIYGALTTLVVHGLRQLFPIQGWASRIVTLLVALGFALLGSNQVGILSGVEWSNMEQLVGFTSGVLLVSQMLYRQLKMDTWPTRL